MIIRESFSYAVKMKVKGRLKLSSMVNCQAAHYITLITFTYNEIFQGQGNTPATIAKSVQYPVKIFQSKMGPSILTIVAGGSTDAIRAPSP